MSPESNDSLENIGMIRGSANCLGNYITNEDNRELLVNQHLKTLFFKIFQHLG